MNPYDVLGVDRTAGLAGVENAYRHQSRKHHPDRGGDPEKFRAVKDAYDLLRDPRRRGSVWTAGSPGGPGSGDAVAVNSKGMRRTGGGGRSTPRAATDLGKSS